MGHSVLSGWTKRYFVLTAKSLAYYEDAAHNNLKGEYALNSSCSITDDNTHGNHPHCFILRAQGSGGDELIIAAETAAICADWKDAIRSVISPSHGSGNNSSNAAAEQANINIAKTFVAKFLGQGDMSVAASIIDANVKVTTGLSPQGPIMGLEAYKGIFSYFIDCFPPAAPIVIEEIFAVGDRVVLRFNSLNTFAKEYYGIAPTYKNVTFIETHCLRFSNGKIVRNVVSATNLEFEMIIAPVMGPKILGKFSDKVLVLGASGLMGTSIVSSLSTKFKGRVTIKAGVRDPASPKAAGLKLAGVELVAADMSQPDKLVAALTGIDTVLVVTPGTPDRVSLAKAGLNACKAAGVKHVMVISFANAEHKGTVFGDHAIAIEECIKGLGLPFTIFRLPFFLDNILGQMGTMQSQGAFYGPLKGTESYNAVVTADAGEAIAKVIVERGSYAGRTLLLSGEPVTEQKIAAAFSLALGKPVANVTIPYEAFKSTMLGYGLPEPIVDGTCDLYRLIEAQADAMTNRGDITAILGRAPISVEVYANKFAIVSTDGSNSVDNESNLIVARKFVAKFLGQGDMSAASSIIDANVKVTTGLSPQGPIMGLEAYKGIFSYFIDCFPPAAPIVIEEIFAVGDRVVLRFNSLNTFAKEYYGIAPTYKNVTFIETHCLRFSNGKIVRNVVSATNLEFEMIIAPVMGPKILGKFSDKVLVLGASGLMGTSIVSSLSTKFKGRVTIKAGVRDPASPKAAGLKLAGVELVAADMSQPDKLVAALTGIDTVLVVTPGTPDRVSLAKAGLNACKAAGVKHVMVISFANAEHKGTVFGDHAIAIEECIKGLGLPFTIFRLPFFLDNILGQMGTMQSQGAFYGPLKGTESYNAVVTADAGEAIAKVIVERGSYAGRTLLLSGEPVTEQKIAAAFSLALGKPVANVTIPYEAFKSTMLGYGLPEPIVDGTCDLYRLIEAQADAMTNRGDITAILGRAPISVEVYAKKSSPRATSIGKCFCCAIEVQAEGF